ncbi:hypothetical protein U9M48_025364 [Paspalum notatum var. saurae]|uniref:Uncharacterized protein n=1 Tax=Paspalum notatum var. saurae TaxID=547442 RepID=A0AAQ3TPY0_PASNO
MESAQQEREGAERAVQPISNEDNEKRQQEYEQSGVADPCCTAPWISSMARSTYMQTNRSKLNIEKEDLKQGKTKRLNPDLRDSARAQNGESRHRTSSQPGVSLEPMRSGLRVRTETAWDTAVEGDGNQDPVSAQILQPRNLRCRRRGLEGACVKILRIRRARLGDFTLV